MRTYKFVGEITNQDLEERRIASGTSCHFNEPERRGLVSLISYSSSWKGERLCLKNGKRKNNNNKNCMPGQR